MSLLVYTKPRVTLLTSQTFHPPEHIKWRSDSEVPGEEACEFAGRVCYLSFGEDAGVEGHKSIAGRSTNAGYLANIRKTRHGSVTEHAVWGFLIEGVSRSLTHELVRHRHLSFSQLSQRYVDETNVAFVAPPELLDMVEAGYSEPYQFWQEEAAHDKKAYAELLELISARLLSQGAVTGTELKKRVRQTARAILPNAAETKIVVTGNARAWRHFLSLRGNETAEREIRRLACELAKQLKGLAPEMFADVTIGNSPNDLFEKVWVGDGSI